MFQSLRNRFGSRMLTTTLAAGAAVVGLSVFASPASAEFQEDAYELRLSGFGTHNQDFDQGSANVSVHLGYFMTDQFEVGVRQDVAYLDNAFTNALDGATAAFINYHFADPGAEVQPFIGASLGYAYGDLTQETFFAGPEGGVKWFFDENWFIFGQIEYQFNFEDAGDADDQFDEGRFNYRLGIGVTI